MMLRLLVCTLFLVAGCFSAHTTVHHGHHHQTTAHHGHHQTTASHGHGHQTTTHHEPDETDNINFKFDHVSHLMLAQKGSNCFIYSMTPDELASVHSLIGLRTLEIKLIGMIASHPQTVPMSFVDLQMSSRYLYSSCKGKAIMQLNF